MIRRTPPEVLVWPVGRLRDTVYPSLQRLPAVGIRHKEQIMGMNKDQVTGRVKETEGKIKETAGKLVGNENLEAKGKIQKTLGGAQAKFGDVKKDMRDLKKGA
jgi:uncharacterized protein YjbJ (UPF0337 family)